MTRRWILGNLDAEETLVATGARVPARVRSVIAGYATLLRAFAEPDDRLALPLAVERGRVVEHAWLPPVQFEVSPPAVSPSDEVLAWMETAAVSALGRDRSRLAEFSWRRPDPAVVARVHDREFAWRVARDLGCALPGSGVAHHLAELRALVDRAEAEAFVAKAPWSASGRLRARFGRAEIEDPRVAERLTGLLATQGRVVVEPWCDRLADFGATGIVLDDGVRLVSMHALDVDPRDGRFLAVAVDPSARVAPGMTDDEAVRLADVVTAVGARLAAEGFRGPFGIDAFRHRTPAEVAFHPLCEINARLTFGWVARELARRHGGPGVMRLRIGGAEIAGRGGVALLAPSGPMPGMWWGST